ncbi:MAG TPA: RHS repeat-associated core domain-containing protein [Oligoflexus sp.]|uniref:RHS repeat-associated core domain-containing protein n=1 Tax=Oligoflexus sp. TaxID=1971216 RepID=UPI002D6AFBD4|nr:RHS repeat-associated core domain-containing protein [Oligoflexus sp.]HYX37725.1 RHS repeat-associated core domain-containing protein [Oligoflexus sp.]
MSFSRSLLTLLFIILMLSVGCSSEKKSLSRLNGIVTSQNTGGTLPVVAGALPVSAEVSQLGYAQSSIPLEVLPVGSGFSPKLSLIYSSSMSAGDVAGYGWNLGGISSIGRCAGHRKFEGAHRAIGLNNLDSICIDGQKLLLVEGQNLQSGAVYRPFLDDFRKINFNGEYFQLTTRSGEKWTFGESKGSREYGNATTALTWYLNRIEDRSGNAIDFTYFENGQRLYLDKVLYGGNRVFNKPGYRSIEFKYVQTGRPHRRYIAGREFDSELLLTGVDVASSSIQWSYELAYRNIENFAWPVLDSIQQCFKGAACFPATRFHYQGGQTPRVSEQESRILKEYSTTVDGIWSSGRAGRAFQDINGDGFTDFIAIRKSEVAYSLGSRDGMGERIKVPFSGSENWDPNYDMFSLNDMDGDGYPDIVTFLSNATMNGVFVARWNGSGYESFRKISGNFGIGWSVRSDFRYIADANNDGLPDIMGIRADGVYLALNQNGTFVGGDTPVLAAMGFNHAWSRVEHPRFFVDVNADGLIDILGLWRKDVQVALGNGTGFDPPTQWMNGFGYDRFYSNTHAFRRIADMNGDGLIDLVGYALDGIYVALNTGRGFAQDEKWLSDQIANKRWDSSSDRRFLFDANRDGLADFVGFKKEGVQIIYGEGRPIDGKEPVVSEQLTRLLRWSSSAGEIEIEDLDANGSLEFLFSDRDGYWRAEMESSALQLTGIEDGLGNVTSFAYADITDSSVYTRTGQPTYPKIPLAGHFSVVREISRTGSNGVDFKVTYQYEDAVFDVEGFGFLGFAKRMVIDHNSSTETHEYFSHDTERLIHGSLVKAETFSQKGGRKIINRTGSEFEVKVFADHPLHRFAYEKSSLSNFFDEAGAEIYTVKVDSIYDDFRNAKHVETKVQDGYGTYTTVVESVFENDQTSWQIGRVKQIKTTKSDSLNTGKIVNVSEFGYDSEGRMSFELQEPGSPLWIKKEFQRNLNPYGLVDAVVTSWGPEHGEGLGFSRVTSSTTKYDGQGFVREQVNALGHLASQAVDPDTGLVTDAWDMNGLKTTYTYDKANRIETITTPSLVTTRIERGFCDASCPANAKSWEKASTQGFGEEKTWRDSFGRVVRSVKSLSTEKQTAQDQIWHSNGQIWKVSKPYFTGEQPKYWTEFAYDNRNRQKSIIFPDQTRIETVFSGLTTTQYDALGHTKTLEKDARGLLLKVTNAKNESISYRYDAAGRMTTLTDDAGNITSMDHDVHGRRTRLVDPTTGTTSTTYNAFGLPAVESNGNTGTNTSYDALGRPLSRTRLLTGQAPFAERFSYDTRSNGIGMPATANGPDSTVTYDYDSLSRPSETVQILLGKTYRSWTRYDALGRVEQLGYPSGFAVDHVYGGVSELTEIRAQGSQKALWKLQELYPNGAVRSYKLGNGSTVYVNLDEKNDRVSSNIATTPGLGSLVSKSYDYYDNGSLRTREDALTGVTESFTYDEIDRLKTFTGPDLKTVTMKYDGMGRIESRSDVGTYEYGQGCAGGVTSPFALKKIGTRTFCADSRGNFLKSDKRSLVYNALDLPTEVRDGTNVSRFVYGLGGQLLSREDLVNGEKTTTLYAGEGFETFESTEGTVQRHYVGGFLVVEMEGSEYRENYLYKDYLGSNIAVADHSGQVTERFDYDPYGQRRNGNSLNWIDGFKPKATSRGFTGHEQIDSMNLVHMKGRMYDPTIGLFLSADPYVQDPTEIQNLNRYTYVMNNPLAYNDPTGHFFSSRTLKHWGRQISNVGKGAGDLLTNPGRFLSNNWEKGRSWISNSQNQRLVMSIAISAAATWIGPGAGALWYQQMAYSAAVGYTSSYVASGGDSKAALNGAITGAAFSLVGSAFYKVNMTPAVRIGKVAAHGMVGGVSSVSAGGKFESGFLSAGLSQAIGQGLDESGYGFSAEPKGWEYASNAAIAAVVGGTVSEATGGSFEQGALTAAMGRLMNDGAHARMMERTQLERVGIDQREVDEIAFGVLQSGIDALGAMPGLIGCTADGVNAGLYAVSGDFESALGSLQGAIGNDSAKFAKYMTTAGSVGSSQKSIRSLEKRLQEHRDKLEKFSANPDLYDNKGHLKNAPTPEIRSRIINTRINHLQGEIRNFENWIEKLKNGG